MTTEVEKLSPEAWAEQLLPCTCNGEFYRYEGSSCRNGHMIYCKASLRPAVAAALRSLMDERDAARETAETWEVQLRASATSLTTLSSQIATLQARIERDGKLLREAAEVIEMAQPDRCRCGNIVFYGDDHKPNCLVTRLRSTADEIERSTGEREG